MPYLKNFEPKMHTTCLVSFQKEYFTPKLSFAEKKMFFSFNKQFPNLSENSKEM
jgi:hypothetical protein